MYCCHTQRRRGQNNTFAPPRRNFKGNECPHLPPPPQQSRRFILYPPPPHKILWGFLKRGVSVFVLYLNATLGGRRGRISLSSPITRRIPEFSRPSFNHLNFLRQLVLPFGLPWRYTVQKITDNRYRVSDLVIYSYSNIINFHDEL